MGEGKEAVEVGLAGQVSKKLGQDSESGWGRGGGNSGNWLLLQASIKRDL